MIDGWTIASIVLGIIAALSVYVFATKMFAKIHNTTLVAIIVALMSFILIVRCT